ncbi:MAG: hypothetical protein ACI4NJ_00570 [Cellvibrio sp.]
MITYRFSEESAYINYYAIKLDDQKALAILARKQVDNADEATYLSEFFWRMVDASIVDESNGLQLPWPEGAEFWNEKLMNSISGYLEQAGYQEQWEAVVDSI